MIELTTKRCAGYTGHASDAFILAPPHLPDIGTFRRKKK